MLALEKLRQSEIEINPFPYLIIPGFIKSDSCKLIHRDYPGIKMTGSFPIQELSYGPEFQKLIDQLNSDHFRSLMEEKFHIRLEGLPTITTVRGNCAAKDGRIHVDSITKIITILIYMNPSWEKSGGQLRLLRSAEDIDDYFCEVPPIEGTLLAFKVTDNSWHGHLPYVGQRRVIQFNWLTSPLVAKRELQRHRFSAKIKKTKNWLKEVWG